MLTKKCALTIILPLMILVLVLLNSNLARSANYSPELFSGTINNELKINLKLTIKEEEITGSYYYKKIGKQIKLKGTIDKEKEFIMKEYHHGDLTGLFKGKFVSKNKAKGIWTDPDGTKELPFVIKSRSIKTPIEYYIRRESIKEKFSSRSDSDSSLDWVSLVKIIADFNNDGQRDCAVSCTLTWSQSNGGNWYIFFREKDGTFQKYNSLYFNPKALSLYSQKEGVAKANIYWHHSARKGSIAGLKITKNSIKTEGSYKVKSLPSGKIEAIDPEAKEKLDYSDLEKINIKIKECELKTYLNQDTVTWEIY
jgi:hypothetical protein